MPSSRPTKRHARSSSVTSVNGGLFFPPNQWEVVSNFGIKNIYLLSKKGVYWGIIDYIYIINRGKKNPVELWALFSETLWDDLGEKSPFFNNLGTFSVQMMVPQEKGDAASSLQAEMDKMQAQFALGFSLFFKKVVVGFYWIVGNDLDEGFA